MAGPNVLIETEQILRVVPVLDVLEPLVLVVPERRPDAQVAFLAEEVEEGPSCGMGEDAALSSRTHSPLRLVSLGSDHMPIRWVFPPRGADRSSLRPALPRERRALAP